MKQPTHQLVDGKRIAENIHNQSRQAIQILKQAGTTPTLSVILVGNDPASTTYVRKKGEAARSIGIDFKLHSLPDSISTPELIRYIQDIQTAGYLSGLIVQLPLPKHIATAQVINTIDPAIDVDCLTDTNLGKLVMNNATIVPPTPGAVMSILEELNISVRGKNITIVGTGALVGKPLAIMLMNAGASITTINSHTLHTKEKCLAADIIVTGVGKKDLLRGDMVRDGAVVIDTGVDFAEGKMYGDVNVAEVLEKAAYVTPTPGGVGPITVARLLWNTVLCAKKV